MWRRGPRKKLTKKLTVKLLVQCTITILVFFFLNLTFRLILPWIFKSCKVISTIEMRFCFPYEICNHVVHSRHFISLVYLLAHCHDNKHSKWPAQRETVSFVSLSSRCSLRSRGNKTHCFPRGQPLKVLLCLPTQNKKKTLRKIICLTLSGTQF